MDSLTPTAEAMQAFRRASSFGSLLKCAFALFLRTFSDIRGRMISLLGKQRASREEVARVRDAVEAMLPAGELDDVAVMVAQIECREPSCVPVETVVSLLIVGAPRKAKVFKPVAEVTEEDLRAILPELLTAAPAPAPSR